MFKISVIQKMLLLLLLSVSFQNPNILNVFHLSECVRFYNQYLISLDVCTLTIKINL